MDGLGCYLPQAERRASGIGANHKRERVWIMAHSNDARDRTSRHEINGDREKIVKEWQEQSQFKSGRQSQDMENARRSLREGIEFERTDANEIKEGNANQSERSSSTSKSNVANSKRKRLQGSEQYETHTRETETQFSASQSFETTGDHWTIEPDVGRVAHGIPNRVDRLKSLGNSLVPQIPYLIGNCIKEIEGL
jgi:DNA (cytosine-5)-methyltransferase 1